jgi:hypothetical protein
LPWSHVGSDPIPGVLKQVENVGNTNLMVSEWRLDDPYVEIIVKEGGQKPPVRIFAKISQ